jgi:hypothetical protein
MIDIMSAFGSGMTIQDIDESEELIQQFMEGYVDDISNYVNNNFDEDNINMLRDKLQSDGHLWAGLLSASGGQLEWSKCFYYLLTWHWDKYGNPTPQSIEQQNLGNTTINLAAPGQPPQFIHQRNISESHKTLGTHKNISGDESVHIQSLRTKSDDMIAALGAGHLNRRQTKIAYNSNYIPSMIYSTPAMCIGEEDMYRITQKWIARFLQLLGIEKNYPRAAVFAPCKYGGIGLKHLYTASVCSKLESLVSNMNDGNTLGIIMRRVLNWIQKLCGTKDPILESNIRIPHVYNWFMAV